MRVFALIALASSQTRFCCHHRHNHHDHHNPHKRNNHDNHRHDPYHHHYQIPEMWAALKQEVSINFVPYGFATVTFTFAFFIDNFLDFSFA